MEPPAETVHWLFSLGFILLGLFLACEVAVGPEVWRMRPWRAYLWPGFLFLMGCFMWAVSLSYTNSTVHMIAHGIWAQMMMIAGACTLGLAAGKLRSPLWNLSVSAAFLVSGAATLIHESQGWFFNRSAFLHHVEGWTGVGAALIPLGLAFLPKRKEFPIALACVFFAIAVLLLCDRDVADIFGHISPDAVFEGASR